MFKDYRPAVARGWNYEKQDESSITSLLHAATYRMWTWNYGITVTKLWASVDVVEELGWRQGSETVIISLHIISLVIGRGLVGKCYIMLFIIRVFISIYFIFQQFKLSPRRLLMCVCIVSIPYTDAKGLTSHRTDLNPNLNLKAHLVLPLPQFQKISGRVLCRNNQLPCDC